MEIFTYSIHFFQLSHYFSDLSGSSNPVIMFFPVKVGHQANTSGDGYLQMTALSDALINLSVVLSLQ